MDFLLEIGLEELPHGFINPARTQLHKAIDDLLIKNAIDFKEILAFSTPRRLAVLVKDIASSQKEQTLEKKGPILKAAFKDGKMTPAALGFCKSCQSSEVAFDDLLAFEDLTSPTDGIYKRTFNNQEFLFSYKYVPAKKTSDILSTSLASLISEMQFPKVMRWGNGNFSFARPIHWLLCLLGDKTISFDLAGILSSNVTFGHPQLFPRKDSILINKPADYLKALLDKKVIANHLDREENISSQLDQIEKTHKLQVLERQNVLKLVTNLVEYPHLVVCEFDKEFLQVPKEVLISEMVEHQMYFPLGRADGSLSNKFIVTSNIEREDYVQKGNVKVLTSRLRDGAFLFDEDKKIGLSKMGDKLETIVFQKDLGSMKDKVNRVSFVAKQLLEMTDLSVSQNDLDLVSLMKNDLTSNMVYEFPNLQGVMGYYYAKESGFSEEQATAIKEHYYPLVAGGDLPTSSLGDLLSLAEKLENILGCYAVGLIPTGSNDPYALRRQAQGIIRIVIEKSIFFNLKDFLEKVLPEYEAFINQTKSFKSLGDCQTAILSFFKTRVKTVFKDYDFSGDEVDSALYYELTDIYKLYLALKDLHRFRSEENFKDFIAVLKRATNIIKKEKRTLFNPEDLLEPAEKDLWASYLSIKDKALDLIARKQYLEAYKVYGELKNPLANFFEKVMVHCEDKNVQSNRINLLFEISSLFEGLLDFNRITI